jgi:hypothetical protein
MPESDGGRRMRGRRRFLLQASGAGAAAVAGVALAGAVGKEESPAEAEELLPTITLGKHHVTRLIAGWNPIGGHSHTTLNMARVMREHFTTERTVDFLRDCERKGINTWQYDHTEKGVTALRTAREQGCRLQCICLHAERAHHASLKKVMAETAPIAIVHHGGVTDGMFRAGRQEKVHDFVKKVHDAGALAGVSAHNPENIRRVADAGWEVDLFMCCFYYVTRPVEEQRGQLGKVTVGEPFFESDPLEMTGVMRAVEQPCLGFKLLAAGRIGWTKFQVEKAFKFAFGNIKRSDAVIVGMFPKYYDEITDDAAYAGKYGAV